MSSAFCFKYVMYDPHILLLVTGRNRIQLHRRVTGANQSIRDVIVHRGRRQENNTTTLDCHSESTVLPFPVRTRGSADLHIVVSILSRG
jgi:hypothetical protein